MIKCLYSTIGTHLRYTTSMNAKVDSLTHFSNKILKCLKKNCHHLSLEKGDLGIKILVTIATQNL